MVSRTISSAVLALALAVITKAKPMTENQTYLDEARQRAKGFETELEPERLREAYMGLENVVLVAEHDPKTRARLKSECLIEWLRLLQLLDRFLDTKFDPRDVPDELVEPPPIPGGAVLRPGADPALIHDPIARAEYEKAIAASRAKANQYRLQTQLHRLNERISQLAEAFIRSSYTSSKRDQEELRNAINKIIKDPKRKAGLLEILEPRPRN